MKFGLSRVAAATLVILAGCSTDVKLENRPLFGTHSVVTVLLYDGFTTGEVDNATVELQVGPSVFKAKRSGNAYTLSDIPNGDHLLFINAGGYLPFTAVADVDNGSSNAATPQFLTATLALFPEASVSEDFIIEVYDVETGEPVIGGTVVATLDDEGGLDPETAGLGDEGGLSLAGGRYGVLPPVIVVPLNAQGQATLEASDLVFGATYLLDIYAIQNADNDYMKPELGISILPGQEVPERIVFATPLSGPPVALKTNTEDDGTGTTLIVTFPYPVEVCSEDDEDDWYNMTDGDDDIGDNNRVGTITNEDGPSACGGLNPAPGSPTEATIGQGQAGACFVTPTDDTDGDCRNSSEEANASRTSCVTTPDEESPVNAVASGLTVTLSWFPETAADGGTNGNGFDCAGGGGACPTGGEDTGDALIVGFTGTKVRIVGVTEACFPLADVSLRGADNALTATGGLEDIDDHDNDDIIELVVREP